MVLLDKFDGSIGQEVGQVLTFGIIDFRVGFKVEVLSGADDGLVETPLARMVFSRVADMPFAEHGGGIPSFFQLHGDRVSVQGQFRDVFDGTQRASGPIEAVGPADGVDTGSGRVLSTEDRRARRGTILAVVVVQKSDSLLSKPIDVRGFIVSAAVTRQVGIPKIIGQDKDDVRRCGSECPRSEHSRAEHQR